jgi:hypothetical protein
MYEQQLCSTMNSRTIGKSKAYALMTDGGYGEAPYRGKYLRN